MTSRCLALLAVAALGAGLLPAAPAAAAAHPRLWTARYDGPADGFDEAQAVAVDADNHNVYVTGFATGIGNVQNFVTAGYSATGSRLWLAHYDGPHHFDDRAFAVAVDPGNHNVYVTGYSATDANGFHRVAVTIAYSASGTRLCTARYHAPIDSGPAYAIAVDPSNHNVYVTGSYSYGNGYATVAYNAAGEQLWVSQYSGTKGTASPSSVAVDSSNHNVYVTGTNVVPNMGDAYTTVAYDSAGAQLWVADYNGAAGADVASSIAVDPGNNIVYVTGSSDGDAGNDDLATVAYDPVGTQLWVARYSRTANTSEAAYSVAVDPGNHHVYVTGDTSGGDQNYLTVAYGPAGAQLWVAIYAGPAGKPDVARSVATDPRNHNVYITGYTTDTANQRNYATVSYDPTGTRRWIARYDGPAHDYDQATAVAVDPGNHNVYVTGFSTGTGADYDYATLAYSAV